MCYISFFLFKERQLVSKLQRRESLLGQGGATFDVNANRRLLRKEVRIRGISAGE